MDTPYENSSGRKSSIYNNKIFGLLFGFIFIKDSEHPNKLRNTKIINLYIRFKIFCKSNYKKLQCNLLIIKFSVPNILVEVFTKCKTIVNKNSNYRFQDKKVGYEKFSSRIVFILEQIFWNNEC